MSDEVTQASEEQSFFDDLVGSAQLGEEIVDPKVGKHDSAKLTEVETKFTRDGSKKYITAMWSGMTATDGFTFDQQDSIFPPDEQSLSFGKTLFMEKLRNLEVIPQTHKTMLYFNSTEGVEKLADAIRRKIGQEYPITIKERNGYYDVRVRRRPKVS